MKIEEMRLDGFRNYRSAGVRFDDGVTVISGDNAQGKTNLLEAVYYICTGSSFRTRSGRDTVNFEMPSAVVTAMGNSGGRDRKIEMVIFPDRRPVFTMNGVKARNYTELDTSFSAVLFCPEDLEIIHGGPSVRRKLMDMCISQLRPRYASALKAFTKAHQQKLKIFKSFSEKPSLMNMLPEYNEELARCSAEIIHYRAQFVKSLSARAAEIHSEFSGGEKLEIKYRTVSTIDDPLRPARELFPMVMEHQEKYRAAEIASGQCLTGAHRDDLYIEINGNDARTYASQGQTRTAALSIKLAERDIHYNNKGEYPILLLDDVLSELDPGRQSFILNRIGGGQVFITCCEDEKIIADRTGGRVLRVKNGCLSGR